MSLLDRCLAELIEDTVRKKKYRTKLVRYVGTVPVVQIFVEHWKDNLQFYPNFALFSSLGGMNLDQDFFQESKLSEDQQKRSSPEIKPFFSPNSGEDQKKNVFTRNGTLF